MYLSTSWKWDGTGYPKGLKGEVIPRLAGIIKIADSYDAMTSERAYRKALEEEVAVDEIRKNADTIWSWTGKNICRKSIR